MFYGTLDEPCQVHSSCSRNHNLIAVFVPLALRRTYKKIRRRSRPLRVGRLRPFEKPRYHDELFSRILAVLS